MKHKLLYYMYMLMTVENSFLQFINFVTHASPLNYYLFTANNIF